VSTIAIRAEGLGKRYRLGVARARYKSLRDSITRALGAPLRGLQAAVRRLGGAAEPDSSSLLWALRELSFTIHPGEVVGVVGRNGAGKSTLLKLLARITEPTEGRAEIHGRVGSLLEVGTGFHPELTGRDNIYLNGAILGMGRHEIRRKFDEIAAFAEIERFLDTPVKHYSSGMYMRLAFAVSAHLEPEILLVDEVLAVGDAQFQRKCLGKMGDVARGGRTVLFVSHNMGAVGQLCQRGLVLDQGRLAFDGPVSAAVDHYLSHGMSTSAGKWTRTTTPDLPMFVLEAFASGEDGSPRDRFDIDDPIEIHLRYRVTEGLRGSNLAMVVSRNGVEVFCSFDTDSCPERLEYRTAGEHGYRVRLPRRLLKAGRYGVTLGTGLISKEAFEMQRDVVTFQIEELSEDTSSRGYHHDRPGVVIGAVTWSEA
jgi:lipopolysaccharide transport system ATP-binding protein